MKRLSILGSTGSIGRQALQVCDARGFAVAALAAGRDDKLLEKQIRKYRPAVAALFDEPRGRALAARLGGCGTRVLWGAAGVLECAGWADADLVLNAIVGVAGLRPSLAALESGHPLALANKESMVCGGALVTALARERGLPILPVDSEHSAIFQCLRAGTHDEVEKLIVTASGGPFFGLTAAQTADKTAAEALKHPNWRMGRKITVDSATMMNKGFELMEARWLFGVPPERLEAVVHRESIVHSLVAFRDGAVIAQLSPPDMRLPIQYALDWPERQPSALPRLDLAAVGKLTFFKPDEVNFPALPLCRAAMARGGNAGAAVNGANEEAVALFLDGAIRFGELVPLVRDGAAAVPYIDAPTLAEVLETDLLARRNVRNLIKRR